MSLTSTITSRAKQRTRASPAPLQMPEILSMIFSYLNQYTLSTSVRYVCKQWYSSSYPLIRVKTTLHTAYNTQHQLPVLLSRLHLVTDFCISAHNWDYKNAEWLLENLLTKIDSLRDPNQLRVSKFETISVANNAQLIYPLLPKFSALMDINMTKVSDNIDLGKILETCPRLRSFRADNQTFKDHRLVVNNNITSGFDDMLVQPTKSAIESLVIRGMWIEQGSLEAILEICPRLQVLKFDHIQHIEPQTRPFDRAGFYSMAIESCPDLKQFHFSVLNESLSSEQAESMIQAFSPVNSSSDSTLTELTSYSRNQSDQYKQKSSLNTISILDKDLLPDVSRILFSPFMDPYFSNTITTLEIIPAIDQSLNDCVVHALHNLLCSTTTLLHLIAPSIPYFAEYFDIADSAIDQKSHPFHELPCLSECPASETGLTQQKIWACRKLKTLRLMVATRIHDDKDTKENSRMMFGYISRVCPDLEELTIYREELNLKLEGGLCFLSRLRNLRKLAIVTRTKTTLKKKDLEWIARYPVKKPRSRFLRWFKFSGTSSKKDAHDSRLRKHENLPPGAVTIDEFVDIDSEAILRECRKELEQGLAGEGCWPKLEYLGIRHSDANHNDPDDYLPALVANIRPGLEFSCSYNDIMT
ncbi:hypothetical protein BGZ46_005897 [Entomortierella lignicola]|nr:hypothetical protein BGZ46_005897 [Entomortierella lignicola]